MEPIKRVENMTDKWWKEFVQLELQEGSTYRQIAFFFQNN